MLFPCAFLAALLYGGVRLRRDWPVLAVFLIFLFVLGIIGLLWQDGVYLALAGWTYNPS